MMGAASRPSKKRGDAMTPIESDALAIRAELARRVALVDRLCDGLPAGAIAGELEAIRRAALASGIHPAVTVIHAIDTILARGERGSRVRTGLAILHDAIHCEVADARTCDTFAAACSIRLGH
jgi:hypothetical protein